jgi:ABC-type amino acid transport substrate-binding protein
MMLLWSPFTVVHAAERESAYDRLMRTGVIRCGYVVYTPFYILDLNSGKVSGIFVDIMDEAAKLLSMKVEWTEEAGTPALIEGLKSGRLDALCSGFWPSAARGREVNFSRPLFYSNLGVYVRANDNRFDQSLDSLNQLGVTVAVVDGEMADQISTVSFPKAEKVSLPQTTNVSDLLTVVAFNKADFTISGVNEAADFSKHNPGKVKRVDAHKPIRVFPNVVMTEKGDQKFLSMLNSAFDELDQTGKLEQIISRYENQPGEFLRVARPYEVMEK